MSDERSMMITENGQTTIPPDLRDAYDIDAPGRVTMTPTDDGILIGRVPHPAEITGELEGITDSEGHTAAEALREERCADAEAEGH